MKCRLRVNGVNDLPRRQDETHVAGHCEGGVEIHGNAKEIFVRTDGEVLGHDKDGRCNGFAGSRLIAELYGNQVLEETGQIPAQKFSENGMLALARVHPGDVFRELRSSARLGCKARQREKAANRRAGKIKETQ